jgi:hypothetical protein
MGFIGSVFSLFALRSPGGELLSQGGHSDYRLKGFICHTLAVLPIPGVVMCVRRTRCIVLFFILLSGPSPPRNTKNLLNPMIGEDTALPFANFFGRIHERRKYNPRAYPTKGRARTKRFLFLLSNHFCRHRRILPGSLSLSLREIL